MKPDVRKLCLAICISAAVALGTMSIAFASDKTVSGISIAQLDEATFHALFSADPICALGTLLGGGFVSTNPDDTLYSSVGTVARIQSATYVGTGAAEGLFAYAYQNDCTGGIVAPYTVEIPLEGATLDPILGADLTYIATKFDTPVDFEPLPTTLFTGNLVNFNLSEFGGSFGIGGNTAAGWTDASQVGDVVEGVSTTDNFWSGSILVFVTDRPPVISHSTVTAGIDAGQPDTVATCVPTPGVGPTPGLPPVEVIVLPPEVDPLIEVDLDVKPGSDPNAVNTKSKGNLPIGVYGSDTFDVADIDLSTISVECMGTTSDDLGFAFEDLVVEDVIVDLMIHVPMQNFPWGAPRGSLVTITVTGELLDGTPWVGEDVVLIVK